MKSPRTRWLDTALRAQQTRTMDQSHRMQEAQAARRQAAQAEATATQDLLSLASAWREGRDAGAWTADIDVLYRRFHHQLHLKVDLAAQAHRGRLHAFEQAQSQLQQGYALQLALDECVKRRDQRLAKDALTLERSLAVEAWLLDRTAKKGSA